MKKSLAGIGCAGLTLAAIMALIMGLLYSFMLAPSSSNLYYSDEQQKWLEDNRLRQVRQDAPVFNRYFGYVTTNEMDKESIVAPLPSSVVAQAVATEARKSHVTADMTVGYKEREGIAVTTYDLRFAATYAVANPDSQQPAVLEMSFPFPRTAAVLSDVTFKVDGQEPPGVSYSMDSIIWRAVLDPGQERTIEVSYRAEGVGSFGYGVPPSQRIRDFELDVTLRGAHQVQVPETALAPTEQQLEGDPKRLSWRYRDVITNRSIQIELPVEPSLAFVERVEQLGQFFAPLAAAAPFLTLAFLGCLWVATRLESQRLSLEHLLLALGFFMFYPLFIFSAGFISLPLAFALALIVASALVVGYGARVIGRQQAAIYLVPLLIVFYALLTRGLTSSRYLGIMLVVSGVALIALFMWRVSYRRELLAPPAAEPAPASAAPVEEKAASARPVQARPVEGPRRHCVHCGQPMSLDFKYCPQCGEDAQTTRTCPSCGLAYIPEEDLPAFCPACGKKLGG